MVSQQASRLPLVALARSTLAKDGIAHVWWLHSLTRLSVPRKLAGYRQANKTVSSLGTWQKAVLRVFSVYLSSLFSVQLCSSAAPW